MALFAMSEAAKTSLAGPPSPQTKKGNPR